jgi:hypothetical protein
MSGDRTLAGQRFGVDRRGWVYLGVALAATVAAGLLAAVAAYAALACAAVGAWLTRQCAAVRWTLTVLALVLLVGTALGLSTGVGHTMRGGPITRQ